MVMKNESITWHNIFGLKKCEYLTDVNQLHLLMWILYIPQILTRTFWPTSINTRLRRFWVKQKKSLRYVISLSLGELCPLLKVLNSYSNHLALWFWHRRSRAEEAKGFHFDHKDQVMCGTGTRSVVRNLLTCVGAFGFQRVLSLWKT